MLATISHYLQQVAFNSIVEAKLAVVGAIGSLAWLADVNPDLHGWEEVGLKGMLLFCAGLSGKLFLDALKDHKEETRVLMQEHKEEMEKICAEHKKENEDRELKYRTLLSENNRCLSELSNLTREQADYFKNVTRVIIDGKLHSLP